MRSELRSDKLAIIIPAYNEAKRIGSTIAGIRKFSGADIVVVNDGSTDDTVEAAANAGAKVLSLPFNLGYGAALQTGYRYASEMHYDYIVQMDGDGQHDPSYIPSLLEELQKGAADVVIGSRFLGGGDYKAPLARRMGMAVFGFIASVILKQKVSDPTSGFQGLNRKVVKFYSGDVYPHDYPDADVLIMLHRYGFKIKEVPVKMLPSPKKVSMHSGFKPLYYVFKMFLSIVVTLMRKKTV